MAVRRSLHRLVRSFTVQLIPYLERIENTESEQSYPKAATCVESRRAPAMHQCYSITLIGFKVPTKVTLYPIRKINESESLSATSAKKLKTVSPELGEGTLFKSKLSIASPLFTELSLL